MTEIIDYKKEHKGLYLPKTELSIIEIPEIAFVAVKGKGNPNEAGGEYQKAYPNDTRPKNVLDAAKEWLAGKVKLPYVKNIILNECHAAAREAEKNPTAQAAARTCGQAAATIHAPTHALGLALYGALAIAYDKLGIDANWDKLTNVAAAECTKMEKALRKISVKNESNPAKINWKC